MEKKYRLKATDSYKLIRICPEIHHGLEIIAKDMNCTLQEASYRLLIRGMEWYLIRVKTKTGEAKVAEWVREPGESAFQNERDMRNYSLKRRPVINRRRSQPGNVINRNPRTTPQERPTIPDGYVPGEM